MPAFLAWPILKAFFGGVLGKLWAFLKTLSFWQIVAGCLAIFALVQHFELVHSRHTAAKWQRQFEAEKQALDAIASKKNVQQATTTQNIKTVVKVVHDADERAKVVETAPPAPGCRTKPEILGADL